MFGVISSIIVKSVSTLSQNPFNYLKKKIKAQVNDPNGFSKSDSLTVQSKKKKIY